MTNRTSVERRSEREVAVSRAFDAPPSSVFAAWTRPELMERWWAPRSSGVPLRSCEMDVRVGGGYRLTFGQDPSSPWVFFGKYVEVFPDARLVWTNEESDDGPLTTLTLEEADGGTRLVLHELHPTEQAADAACAGMATAIAEQFEQLDALLATLPADDGAP